MQGSLAPLRMTVLERFSASSKARLLKILCLLNIQRKAGRVRKARRRAGYRNRITSRGRARGIDVTRAARSAGRKAREPQRGKGKHRPSPARPILAHAPCSQTQQKQRAEQPNPWTRCPARPSGCGWLLGGTELRRVVLIFKLAVAAPVLPGVTELGEAEQVASAGMPLHEIATAVLYPDTAVTDTVTLVVLPATTVAEVGFTVTPKSDPPPVNVTTWGLLGAASVTVKAPERVPTTEGAKLTLIVQEAPAARLAGQLFDWVKSPEGIILVILKLAVPLLVKVIGWAALVAPAAGWQK